MVRRLLIAWLVLASSAVAEDWPQFRGPRGDGHAAVKKLPTAWSATQNILWQVDIPGRGWSSPVIAGGRVWLTTAEETALSEAAQRDRLKDNPFAEQLALHASVTLSALELDLKSGKRLRQIELAVVDRPETIHATNSYASPTPVLNDGKLICHFGALGTMCVDTASGEVLWRRNVAFAAMTGPASSPLVWRDLVILTCDGADVQFVTALDARTGETKWRTERPRIDAAEPYLRRAFSTPLLIDAESAPQLIVPGAQWLCAYDPATGKELWRVHFGAGYSTVPRPVAAHGLVYFTTGFMKPELWAVRHGGHGDVSKTHVAWKYDKQIPEISSPLVVDDAIYFVSAKGIATCLDARSGALRWQQRLGGNFAASPLFADGKLWLTSESGQTFVLRPGATYDEVARNQIFGQVMASPAAVEGKLLIRTDAQLICIGKDGT